MKRRTPETVKKSKPAPTKIIGKKLFDDLFSETVGVAVGIKVVAAARTNSVSAVEEELAASGEGISKACCFAIGVSFFVGVGVGEGLGVSGERLGARDGDGVDDGVGVEIAVGSGVGVGVGVGNIILTDKLGVSLESEEVRQVEVKRYAFIA